MPRRALEGNMGNVANLTLRRWSDAVPEGAQPRGRVGRVVTYYLAHARGPAQARSVLDYVRQMEPAFIEELRGALLRLPESRREDEVDRQIGLMKQRVRAAMRTARTRWGIPIVHGHEDFYYVEVDSHLMDLEELLSLRMTLPPESLAEFDRGLARAARLADALEEAEAPHGRGALLGAASRRAQRRWGVAPICYDYDPEAEPLLEQRDSLLRHLTAMVRGSVLDRAEAPR
jgi:hypothetical protein